MSRWLSITLPFAASLAIVAAQGPPPQGQSAPQEISDEILVQFSRTVPNARRAAILSAESGQEIKRFDALDVHHVRLAPGRNIQQVLAALRRNQEVIAAQPNHVRAIVGGQQVTAVSPPNDPLWLDGTLWGLQKIQAQPAWTGFTAGNGSVVIADVDTGVNYNHPDLAANMWRNPGEIPGNGIDDDLNGFVDDVYGIDTYNSDSNPMDDHGHGTHTAGTIAGVGNNGIGVAGVNWNARILACKFIGASGTGSDAQAIGCFNYILALKQRGINIRVTNNSWGGARGIGPPAAALKNAIDALGAAGILNVCAAGNNGANVEATPFDPASFTSSSIVSVAASDQSDSRAGFSNYGVVSVDLAAPGVSIASTYGNGYALLSGTSMAAPMVAGAAAILSTMDPSLSVDSLKFVLMNQVDSLPAWSTLVASGGRLNLLKAATSVGAAPASRVNVAAAANGGTATASSFHSSGYAPAGTINGDRRGAPWGSGGGWNDATADTWPDWLEIAFNGTKTIDEIDVFSVQDNYAAPSEPTAGMTFSLYGLRNFEVQYWTGSAWAPVPGGTITNNALVWRQVTFAAVSTTKIRIWVTAALNTWTRIAEVEAYTSSGSTNPPPTVSLTGPANGATYTAPASIDFTATAADDGSVTGVAFYQNGALVGTDATSPYSLNWPNVAAGTYVLTAVATDNLGATTPSNAVTVTVSPPAGRVNVASAANGGSATASSSYNNGFAPAGTINGDRRGTPWGGGAGWNDATPGAWPDWIEIAFNGTKTIDEIDVFSVQDNYAAPSEPTAGMTFSLYGLRNFEVQYWTGSAWAPVPGGTITNNALVWRQVTFAAVSTTKIRIWVTAAADSWTRITEVEAYASGSAPSGPPPVTPSSITLRADFVGTLGGGGNATSPIVAGAQLLLLNQTGSLYRWNGSAPQQILSAGSAPAGVTPVGNESIVNVAANSAGTSLFVMFTSSTVPAGVPQYASPRPFADAWQVLYRYDFNGTALSNPQGIAALQVRTDGHTGGGMLALDTGPVLFATADNGDAGEDGRQYAQDAGNHLSKILRIDPGTGAVTVLGMGVRNVQRLFLNPNNGDPRVEFVDLGGAIAEELNSVRLADLLALPIENFGWGRNSGDNLAREGTFYIDPAGALTGAAPTPEAGFTQPVAQFGREGAPLVGVTGAVSSATSFTTITALFGDLPTGSVFAVTGASGTANQTVFRVNLVDGTMAPVTLSGLAGGRPDPRFFLFPDGSAGVLLERTGAFYRLTQIGQ
jgi:hypothetical protein